MSEQTSLTVLKGIGPALADKLDRLGLSSVQDLLFHLPMRYQDRTRVTPIGALRPGLDAVIEGTVLGAEVVMGRRRSLLCRIQDGSGTLSLRFYYFSAALKANLSRGSHWRCYGEVRPGASGLEIYHPELHNLDGAEALPVSDTLTPIYPATEGLSQQRLRSLSDAALAWLAKGNHLTEWLPPELAEAYQLPPLREAVQLLHRPPPDIDLEALQDGRHWAQHRLAFEELMAHQLAMLRLRAQMRAHKAPPMRAAGELADRFVAQLGFPLTGAQRRVADEILLDLAQPRPMLRLVQGDVGAGKTVVAALAALQAIEAGWQVALMAPTEILAEQHFNNFQRWFAALGLSVAWGRRQTEGQGAQQPAATDRQRRSGDDCRHPRAVPRRRAVPQSGPGDHRRAAPLRRPAAPRPA